MADCRTRDGEGTGLLSGIPSYETYNKQGYAKHSGRKKKTLTCLAAIVIVICLLVGSNFLVYYLAVGFNRTPQQVILADASGDTSSQSPSDPVIQQAFKVDSATTERPTTKHQVVDNCKGTEIIATFPNIEYSFYGYNILKGNPVYDGVDPGFTRPIFAADFSYEKKTADCRFAVPNGLNAAPNEACSTHFVSQTLNTSEEYDHSLSRKAHASAGIFGFKFSASHSYQKTTQIIQKGYYKLIHSTAKCSYYSSTLNHFSLPPFSDEMQSWLTRLNLAFKGESTTHDDILFRFLDDFGTHFPAYIVYGATHTFESKLTSSSYQNLSSESTSVDAQASFAGLFSIGGGVSFSESQKKMVSKFQSLSEISTKTLGSPPPKGGDASSWVENVQSSPAPIEYDLALIRDLFTYDIMQAYMTNETVTKIQKNLQEVEMKYCNHLSFEIPFVACKTKLGTFVNSTLELKNMAGSATGGSAGKLLGYTLGRCVDKCGKSGACSVAQMAGTTCDLTNESEINSSIILKSTGGSTLVIFQDHLTHNTRLNGYQYDTSALRGPMFNIIDKENDYFRLSERCAEFCRAVGYCRAFEVSNLTATSHNCVLYKNIGLTFWDKVTQFDFETTLLALSPKLTPLEDTNVAISLKISKLDNTFEEQQGCSTVDCCTMTCLSNSICMVSAFNRDSKTCSHMYATHSSFNVNNGTSASPFSITVYPERVTSGLLTMKGYSFPDVRFEEDYSVYSADDCANKCAANARCSLASWDGQDSGKCVLHDAETIELSNRVAKKDAVLLFPTVVVRMSSSKVDAQN